MLLRTLKSYFTTLTWSKRPEWVSPPLQGTRFKRGKFLRRVWVDGALSLAHDGKAYLGLGGIDISYIRDRRDTRLLTSMRPFDVSAETCQALLEQCLGLPDYAHLEETGCVGTLYRLDLAVTEMTPGSQFLRLFEWLTLFGLGHAWVQIEGILSEPASDRVLLKFVERQRHPGLFAWDDILPTWSHGNFPKQLRNSMVGQLIRRIAHNLIMELDQRINKASA